MKILVTGSQGFIGKNLTEYLLDENQIVGWDLPEKMPIVDGFDWVVHLGAISSTTETNIEKIMKYNLEYSQELFQLCNDKGVNFQYASSASVYGKLTEFSENSPVAPESPYAWTKYLFDRWVFQQEQKIIVQGFRYFNVYGPHELHKGNQMSPLSKFEDQAINHGKIKLFYGSEDYKRDFIYVGDICKIHRKFMSDRSSGIYNIGTGETFSFREIAEAIAQKHGAEIEEIEMPDNIAKQYQKYTCADMTKTRKVIGSFVFTNPFNYID